MKNITLVLLLGLLLGAAGGFALGLFFYPFIFLADIIADEEIADAKTRKIIARGEFVHANPADPIHYGRGSVIVYEDLVHLRNDFEVGPGPAFHVYLVPEAEITPETDVANTTFVDLGRLRAFKGSQVYRIPAGVDPARFGSVVIWCAHFGVLISPARLTFEA
jgi:hypothetical protein